MKTTIGSIHVVVVVLCQGSSWTLQCTKMNLQLVNFDDLIIEFITTTYDTLCLPCSFSKFSNACQSVNQLINQSIVQLVTRHVSLKETSCRRRHRLQLGREWEFICIRFYAAAFTFLCSVL